MSASLATVFFTPAVVRCRLPTQIEQIIPTSRRIYHIRDGRTYQG